MKNKTMLPWTWR